MSRGDHNRAGWLEATTLAERLARYLHPEDFDEGEPFEWTAETIENVSAIVDQWRTLDLQKKVMAEDTSLIGRMEKVEKIRRQLIEAELEVERMVGKPYDDFVTSAREMFAEKVEESTEPDRIDICMAPDYATRTVRRCMKPLGHYGGHAFIDRD